MTDYILDRLFRPTRTVLVGETSFTVRALSGPEQESRSLYATHAARAYEKELADPQSDEYQFRLGPLEKLSGPELADYLRLIHGGQIRPQLEKDNPPVYQPFPDDATDSERRAVLDAREAAETARTERIDQLVLAQTQTYFDEQLKDHPPAELLALAQAQARTSLLTERANMAYCHYTLYLVVSGPDGARYFSSPEEAAELSQSVIFRLYRVAREVNEIDPLASNGRSSTG